MNLAGLVSEELAHAWPHRVCLPYGLDLLQLASWLRMLKKNAKPGVEIHSGERIEHLSDIDPVQVFNLVQAMCLGNIVFDSCVLSKDPDAILYFDRLERFCFFASTPEVVAALYPYSREVMWEHYSLMQEDVGDAPLADIFGAVHSSPHLA